MYPPNSWPPLSHSILFHAPYLGGQREWHRHPPSCASWRPLAQHKQPITEPQQGHLPKSSQTHPVLPTRSWGPLPLSTVPPASNPNSNPKPNSNTNLKESAQLCPTLCDPVDCSPPGSLVHGIFQVRVLEWVAISFSRGSSQPKDLTRISRIAGSHFTV